METSFQQNAGLEFIIAILLKTDSIKGIIWYEFCKVPLFNILENLLWSITVLLYRRL